MDIPVVENGGQAPRRLGASPLFSAGKFFTAGRLTRIAHRAFCRIFLVGIFFRNRRDLFEEWVLDFPPSILKVLKRFLGLLKRTSGSATVLLAGRDLVSQVVHLVMVTVPPS